MGWRVVAGITIALAIVICGRVSLGESKPDSANIQSIVDANNQFALDYYSKLKDIDGGNIFFSPFSISNALAMTYEGAKGKTADEMRSVFHFPVDDRLRRTAYEAIFDEINKKDKKYQLKTANALWARKDFSFLKEYMDSVEKYYGGKTTNLDFGKDPEASRITINQWVEGQTNDKIKNLLSEGTVTAGTRLVLTNAIYFKGEWVRQFNKDETRELNFRMTKDKNIKVQMMRRTDKETKFNYVENDKVQILEMPYSGEELSMLIFLPKKDDLKGLENSLTIDQLLYWKKDLKEQKVRVVIPKFRLDTKYSLAVDLQSMGMPTAFSNDADFSGMTGEENLKIDEVIHQAFVEVNEEGTEAAAATAVIMVMGRGADETPFFFVDHPFVFLIQEKATGNILFIGRMTDPTA